ncbi:hypothetical protein V5R22_16010 [Bacillus thuringiensis]|uniref:hypothetical protein n=1 Tax=Bacillus thuringiensis TaxID=1428 RepID=UPI003D563419
MPKQLNIFEVEPSICEFDVMKANVKKGTGRTTYADVRVQVPKNAKCTDELPRTTKQDDRYDIFEQYVIAIWRFQNHIAIKLSLCKVNFRRDCFFFLRSKYR